MQGIIQYNKQLMNTYLYTFRLPNFPITDAVDALTLGSVNFLPEKLSVCYSRFFFIEYKTMGLFVGYDDSFGSGY